MSPTVFVNNEGTLGNPITIAASGFWNSIIAGDYDNDGDTDYVLGNLGTNNKFEVSKERPLTILSDDINNDGVIDGIISGYFDTGADGFKNVPLHPRNEISRQLVQLKKVYTTYKNYAEETTEGLMEKLHVKNYRTLSLEELRSGYLENKGDFNFEFRPLPTEAQFAPIFGMLPIDINNDGNLDIVAVGNSYSSDALTGHYDALNGLVLKGDGTGDFVAIPISKTGFYVPQDAKSLAMLYTVDKKKLLVVTRNDSTALAFESVEIDKNPVVPLPADQQATIHYKDGRKSKIEFYKGSGYLGSSTNVMHVNENIDSIIIQKQTRKSGKL
jgi:hypothetical protein